jgi:hypothetical protein
MSYQNGATLGDVERDALPDFPRRSRAAHSAFAFCGDQNVLHEVLTGAGLLSGRDFRPLEAGNGRASWERITELAPTASVYTDCQVQKG